MLLCVLHRVGDDKCLSQLQSIHSEVYLLCLE